MNFGVYRTKEEAKRILAPQDRNVWDFGPDEQAGWTFEACNGFTHVSSEMEREDVKVPFSQRRTTWRTTVAAGASQRFGRSGIVGSPDLAGRQLVICGGFDEAEFQTAGASRKQVAALLAFAESNEFTVREVTLLTGNSTAVATRFERIELGACSPSAFIGELSLIR